MKPVIRIVVGVLVAASFGVWVYAFSGAADRPPPDELDSTRAFIDAKPDDGSPNPATEAGGLPVFGTRAAVLCTQVVDALPNAADATSGAERSEQLVSANRTLTQMVQELRAMPVDTERDKQLITAWLVDWEIYIGDRADYAAEIAVNEDAFFTLTDLGGERLERRLTRFARTNLMLSCGTPGDVG